MDEMRRTSVGLVALVAVAALSTGVARRTEGVPATETGAERRPNRLIHETSPYLRLHAYNPVDWYPWGAEALEKAKREQKPIFLSVGYSTCYWCHVMEREVFEHPELAEMMNRWFVNIKVDREERPELDEIYMTATQMLTGRGGWPNSVFLTPDLEPFFAGTYFPPEDVDRRPGFRRVLTALHRLWSTERERVLSEAAEIAGAIRQTLAQRSEPPPAEVPGPEAALRAVEQLAAVYDETWGGFGGAPKFPSPSNLYLLRERADRGDAAAERMLIDTLKQMGRGAIYDQLDGGFHRYTLDAAWRVPHFEKMLYDNAHVGELLATTAAATGDAELERLARGTFDFVLEWMTLPSGAFKSAIDAETDAVEGAYYIWTRDEFRSAVGEAGYELLAPIFGVDGEPNFEEHHYTLYLTRSLDAWAAQLGLGRKELLARMAPHLESLRRARGEREFPLVDEKVLADWNGMMIAALARAGAALGEPRWVGAAERAARFVLGMRDGDGVQLHTWHRGEARIEAFLDDYAFMIRALLTLDDVTGSEPWLAEARRLAEQAEERLRAPAGGYYTSAARPDLLVQVVSAVDSALPSGNGVMIRNLRELAERTGQTVYRQRADAALRVFAGDLERYPRAVTTVALAVLERDGGVGVRGEPSADERAAGEADPTSGRGEGVGSGGVGELAREVVEVRAEFSGEAGDDGWRAFRVELRIREGWHVNANPASLEFLIPTRVEGGARDVRYPRGEPFRFDFVPDEILVYGGETVITGSVEPGREEVDVTYQPCDDRRCLPPVTETVRLRE